MSRKRSSGRPKVPNLTIRERSGVVYYGWLDPRDGKEKSLKATDDEAQAIDRARKLNALVAQELADKTVKSIYESGKRHDDPTIAEFVITALEIYCATRNPSANTIRTRKSCFKVWSDAVGTLKLTELTTKRASEVLRDLERQGKHRMALGVRTALIDLYSIALSEGVVPDNMPNIGNNLRSAKVEVKRSRLTLDQWQAIYAEARKRRNPWEGDAMLLALVTGQRLGDLVRAQFKAGRDWQGLWLAWQERRGNVDEEAMPYPHVDGDVLRIVQQKTDALIAIPLDLRLEVIETSVGDAIAQCRNRVTSRWLLHHTRTFATAEIGMRVNAESISEAFRRAREASGLTWPGHIAPSFHEQRSLSERLYRAQGVDTQRLLGHKSPKTTSVYDDARRAEWETVQS